MESNRIVFKGDWFREHQGILVFLCNFPVLGRWFRVGIGVNDYGNRVSKVLPSGYHVLLRDGNYRAEFFTKEFVGWNLYKNFKLVWHMMHLWDMIVESWMPRLSFGFGTLTAYPDTGTGGTTVDGRVERESVEEAWNTIRTSTGTLVSPTGNTATLAVISHSTTDRYARMVRFVCTFDTSSIDDAATIGTTTFSLFTRNTGGGGKSDGLSMSPALVLVSSSPAVNNNLQTSDYLYTNFGSTSFGSLAYSAWSTTDQVTNDISLNASGKAAINKTGVTALGVRMDDDIDNVAPTWSSSVTTAFDFYPADGSPGQPAAPKLVVNYGYDYSQVATETLSLTDSLSKTITRVLSDTLSMVDSAIRDVSRIVIEQLSLVDLLSVIKPIERIFTESISLVDSVFKSLARTLSESVSLSDIVTKMTSKVLSVTLSMGDILSRVFSAVRVLSESFSLGGSILRFWNGVLIKFTWSKTARPSDNWTKGSRPTNSWTKQE